MDKKKNPTKVITGKVRFSYAHVYSPKAIDEGSKAKYSVAVLVSKDDTATLDALNAAIAAATVAGKAKWGGKIPAESLLKLPLRDGDEEHPDDDAYTNCMFFNASSDRKPQIVDVNRNHLDEESNEFYSGCYGKISVNFYPFNMKRKGVAAGLGNILKLEDGERLSGGASAAEDFFSDDDDDLLG